MFCSGEGIARGGERCRRGRCGSAGQVRGRLRRGALRVGDDAVPGGGSGDGGNSGVRSDGPLMRMVMQWCWRRSSRASTRGFFWNSSYHSGKSRFNAERIVMRTLVLERPRFVASRASLSPHKGGARQGGDQLVAGAKASRAKLRCRDRVERFKLDGRVGAGVHLGGLHVGMTEP